MFNKLISVIAALFMYVALYGQQSMPLYEGAIPNSKPAPDKEKTSKDANGFVIVSKISRPTLTIFLPPRAIANGTAVIIFPGGGYYVNAVKHEGSDIAELLAKNGIAAFVLKYRTPDDEYMLNKSIGPLQDAQRAMIVVRSHAKEWNVDTEKVGIMGFSAGGHLAATLGTHFKNVVVDDPAHISVRPSFMVLGYPGITTDSTINKTGLSEKLLGKNASAELLNDFSAEKQVTNETPPCFIMQSTDDPLPVENSIVFYQALVKNKVPAEMHLYQGGGHGYGLNNKTTRDKWIDRCINWMDANGWLNAKK
jgi:acetyl esterase/lipase